MAGYFEKLRHLTEASKKSPLRLALPVLAVLAAMLYYNDSEKNGEATILELAQEDPKIFAILERMRLVNEVNKDPNYFFDNFSVFVNSGLFDKDDIYKMLYNLSDKVKIETLLRFILNNNLEDYINDRFLNKIFWASLDKHQQDVFYTLLSYNLRPALEELARSDTKSREILLHIMPGVVEMINLYTLKLPLMTEKDWEAIRNAARRKWGDKESEKYLEHMKRLSATHNNINPIFVAQTLWSIAKLARYYSLNYGYENPKTAISAATWSYMGAVKDAYKEKIFKRNIVLIDHNERYKSGKDRFGTKAFRDALKNRGRLIYVPDSLDSELRKRKLLNLIKTVPNMTLYIDAHGAKDAVYISNGYPDKNIKAVKISIEEFASALTERYKRLGGKGYDISIIFSACYSNNLAYGILSALPLDVPIPLIISNAEFSQVSFSNPDNPYGSNFDELMAKLKGNSVKDFILETLKPENTLRLFSNPSVFTRGPVKEGDKQAYGVSPHYLRFLRFLQLG